MGIQKETSEFVGSCQRLMALAKQEDSLTLEEADIALFYAKELSYELLPHCSAARAIMATDVVPSEDEEPPFAQAA
jgi:hypothetical protein